MKEMKISSQGDVMTGDSHRRIEMFQSRRRIKFFFRCNVQYAPCAQLAPQKGTSKKTITLNCFGTVVWRVPVIENLTARLGGGGVVVGQRAKRRRECFITLAALDATSARRGQCRQSDLVLIPFGE